MNVLSLIVFSVAFLGLPKRTEGWCGLASSSALPQLLSASLSSSCTTVSGRQRHIRIHRHQRSASFTRLAAAKSNSDQKSAEINIEAIKAELTEYLIKRKEMNADDLAKLYVR
jgi:outer membrane PBP1 activator LpoA protein